VRLYDVRMARPPISSATASAVALIPAPMLIVLTTRSRPTSAHRIGAGCAGVCCQRVRSRSPAKSQLRATLRIGSNATRIVIGSTGDQARTKLSQDRFVVRL
jgi:hypothetical protein